MKNQKLILSLLAVLGVFTLSAQNPIIRDQFTADPSARIFNGKVYLFPSHDIKAPEGKNLRKDWFCMADYHVFSSDNLTEWTDHGVIVSQEKVPWVDSTTYSMWAPDCVERNGKYYFYFPANKNTAGPNGRKGFGIGVAVADKPEGPYIPQPEPIKGIFGIDPNILIDKDGQAYIYYSMGNIFVAKLKENMVELDSEPVAIPDLPAKGLKEGPWTFERNGIYYLTFPHVENKIERLEYAMGNSPMGPFKMTGVIMDESPLNCWTNHQSFIEKDGQWYLFYHQNEYSPKFDKNRSACIDSMFFNADGTIQKVKPTFRGVGLTSSNGKIEIDRYSVKSESGASIALLDTVNTFAGWKAILDSKNAWIQYNSVDFGTGKYKKAQLKVRSENGGIIQIFQDSDKNSAVAEISIPKGNDWKTIDVKVSDIKTGVHNLLLVLKEGQPVEMDWIMLTN
ncbi:MAG TPA: family 43 glycosylhydrolase [Draconibacterium sp.]|nr:family 43 glycosylhydrolase [Draconibacterium sp.]